jgi:hypothetical protein
LHARLWDKAFGQYSDLAYVNRTRLGQYLDWFWQNPVFLGYIQTIKLGSPYLLEIIIQNNALEIKNPIFAMLYFYISYYDQANKKPECQTLP